MTEQIPPPPQLLLTIDQAAQALQICQRKLWSLTSPRGPISAVKIGRSVRYDPRDLLLWIDERKSGS